MQRPTGMVGFRVSPGEEQALEYVDDIRITNIAFGEEVKGTGRTVVRVHHRRIPDFDDIDEDFGLDDIEDDESEDDDDDDEDEDEDEDDEDEDQEVDTEALLSKKAKKTNGVAAVNGVDEDDEDDEDEDDEESLLEEEEEHTYILCSLYPGKIEQVSVDLSFTVADDVRFSISGENAVEIMGNIMKPSLLDTYDEEPDDDEIISDYDYDSEEDDESIDSDDAIYAQIEGDDDSDDEDDDDDDDDLRLEELDEDDDDDDEEDVDDEEAEAAAVMPVIAGKKRSAAEADVDDADEDVSMTAPVTDAELTAAAKAAGLDPSKLSKNQRKKLNKRLRGAGADDSVEVESAAVATKTSDADGKAKVTAAAKDAVKKDGKTVAKSTTLPSGVVVEDRKVGTGPAAKAGNRLGMRYVGRLQSGKQFDANTKGKPFTFRLGKGEVIGGWDEGLKGMQVGGERRLVIPPKMGYGARGAPPDIPGNATLVFDVKLVEIK